MKKRQYRTRGVRTTRRESAVVLWVRVRARKAGRLAWNALGLIGLVVTIGWIVRFVIGGG